ncbi:MAG: GNAT family N-acetyltransferase [Chloroflexi bacterium]|nr:GNAT family N-acetyltransferase [Chloroflexota bacterium]
MSLPDEQWGVYLSLPRLYARRYGEEFVTRGILRPWAEKPPSAMVMDVHVVVLVGIGADQANRRAELGYGIARRLRGSGLTVEAVSRVLVWTFPAFRLDQVFARADGRSVQSHSRWHVGSNSFEWRAYADLPGVAQLLAGNSLGGLRIAVH